MPPLWGLRAADPSIAKVVADQYGLSSRGLEYDKDFGDISPPRLFCAYEALRFGNTRTAILFILDAEVSTDCLSCYHRTEAWLKDRKFTTDEHFADLVREFLFALGKEHESHNPRKGKDADVSSLEVL